MVQCNTDGAQFADAQNIITLILTITINRPFEIFSVMKLSEVELDKLTELQQKNLTMQCWQSIPQAKQMELARTMFGSKTKDKWDHTLYLMNGI